VLGGGCSSAAQSRCEKWCGVARLGSSRGGAHCDATSPPLMTLSLNTTAVLPLRVCHVPHARINARDTQTPAAVKRGVRLTSKSRPLQPADLTRFDVSQFVCRDFPALRPGASPHQLLYKPAASAVPAASAPLSVAVVPGVRQLRLAPQNKLRCTVHVTGCQCNEVEPCVCGVCLPATCRLLHSPPCGTPPSSRAVRNH
jgi:hypothetical protein